MIYLLNSTEREYGAESEEEWKEPTEEELEALIQKAEAGDAETQLWLGQYYAYRAGKKLALYHDLPSGSPNLKGASAWWDRNPITDAAEADRRIAFQWFERAAAQGNAEAIYELGGCYLRGEGTALFPEKAFELLVRAANAGNMFAQYDLGMLYLYGKKDVAEKEVVPKNEPLAVEWLSKAAEQGDSLAQYQLGLCYEEGIGVKADEAQAMSWYEKSAERGNELAAQALEDLKS